MGLSRANSFRKSGEVVSPWGDSEGVFHGSSPMACTTAHLTHLPDGLSAFSFQPAAPASEHTHASPVTHRRFPPEHVILSSAATPAGPPAFFAAMAMTFGPG